MTPVAAHEVVTVAVGESLFALGQLLPLPEPVLQPAEPVRPPLLPAETVAATAPGTDAVRGLGARDRNVGRVGRVEAPLVARGQRLPVQVPAWSDLLDVNFREWICN